MSDGRHDGRHGGDRSGWTGRGRSGGGFGARDRHGTGAGVGASAGAGTGTGTGLGAGAGVPAVSRMQRGGTRGYRTLSRTSGRFAARQRRQVPIAELVGALLQKHGLTDEVRRQMVCIYWPEIAGERLASKTSPQSFSETVLHLAATTSSWVHEMQFYKAPLVEKINAWVAANRVWLGDGPLVTEIRVSLGTQRRDRLVDPEQVQRLRMRQLRRLRRAPDAVPPAATEADRALIREQTEVIADAELRAVIEAVRLKWNC